MAGDRARVYTGAGIVLETHVVPAERTSPLPAVSFGDLKRTIAQTAGDEGLFELGQAIDFSTDETAVTARGRRVTVADQRQACEYGATEP
ncbi:MAG: hypothetical protein H0U52_13315 [Chloroflexi bacterium]|nr:hypothetical protein [Chloroflexota bacterium]